jgi:hypothetical protein
VLASHLSPLKADCDNNLHMKLCRGQLYSMLDVFLEGCASSLEMRQPVMLAVLVAKTVADSFEHRSIYGLVIEYVPTPV